MTVFVSIAALLVVVALLLVLRPLIARHSADGSIARDQVNLAVIRDQLRELDNDLRIGVMSTQQHERARDELERRALEEAQASDAPKAKGGRSIATAAAVGIALPVLAALLYFQLGTPQGLNVKRSGADSVSSVTRDEFVHMTEKLAQRLASNPNDAEGWAMLGRAYRALDRFDDAAMAWMHAAKLNPKDASVLADYAESLAMSRQGQLQGEPSELLARALKIDPENPKALALSGGAAFERGDYKAAIAYWQRLLAKSGNDPEMTQALNAGIAEARMRLTGKPAPAASISGTVTLAPALAAQARPDDTVFVFVQAAQGPRMPLAITRVQVKNLPYDFRLDDSMAMVPDMKLSKFPEVVVGARVSRSGNAQRSAGDLEGSSKVVKPGAEGIHVVIDRAVQ